MHTLKANEWINEKKNMERAMENTRLNDPINCERLSEVLLIMIQTK